jgi:hypothetical protein
MLMHVSVWGHRAITARLLDVAKFSTVGTSGYNSQTVGCGEVQYCGDIGI